MFSTGSYLRGKALYFISHETDLQDNQQFRSVAVIRGSEITATESSCIP